MRGFGLGLGSKVARGRRWAPLAGAVIDIDFRASRAFGMPFNAITASAGTLKITASGLQVLTGDAIVAANLALLEALNAPTTVIRAQVIAPSDLSTSAGAQGFFLAKVGTGPAIVQRFRGTPNQTGLAAGHSATGGGIGSFGTTAVGSVTNGQRVIAASRHTVSNATLTANGSAVSTVAVPGKTTAIDSLQFGIGETGVVLGSYIERLTIWTDNPTDTELRARSV